MIKVCLDTNVFLSAIIFGGKPENILRRIEERKISLIVSPAILVEIARILENKFGRNENEIIHTIKHLAEIAVLIRPKNKIKKISHDPDNRILECAIEGKVNYIVTGDKKHLLPLKRFKNVPIVSPDQFLALQSK